MFSSFFLLSRDKTAYAAIILHVTKKNCVYCSWKEQTEKTENTNHIVEVKFS